MPLGTAVFLGFTGSIGLLSAAAFWILHWRHHDTRTFWAASAVVFAAAAMCGVWWAWLLERAR